MAAKDELADVDCYYRRCRERLEAALLEYVERYGLTETARDALTYSIRLNGGCDGEAK